MPAKNLDAPLLDLAGRPLADADGPVTVRTVAVNALLGAAENQNATGVQKAERYRLAVRLAAGGEQTLSPEELVTVKQLVGSHYLPLVVGQVFEWADN